MAKTVKDEKNWLLFSNNKIDKKLKEIFTAEIITESMILDLNDLYEIECAKKDKEINNLKFDNNMAKNYINKLKTKQLYKEDFDIANFCINCRDELFVIDNIKKIKVNKNDKCNTCGWDRIIKLKDNLDYDKLPSKEEQE